MQQVDSGQGIPGLYFTSLGGYIKLSLLDNAMNIWTALSILVLDKFKCGYFEKGTTTPLRIHPLPPFVVVEGSKWRFFESGCHRWKASFRTILIFHPDNVFTRFSLVAWKSYTVRLTNLFITQNTTIHIMAIYEVFLNSCETSLRIPSKALAIDGEIV